MSWKKSTKNIENNIGEKTDFIHVPYQEGINSILAHLNTNYYHVHGRSFIYPDKAAPVELTSGNLAWGTGGNLYQVIPANTINDSAYDLHWINISDISTNSDFVIDIYAGGAGAERLIGSTKGWRSNNLRSEGVQRIQIPQQPPGTRISCRLSDSTAGTITLKVSFEGHLYTE